MNEKVKQALENVKNIKVASMTLNDLFGEDLKVIENALNDFDKYHESQQDLIKGKDEYIAKLCNDRAEFKDLCKEYQNKNVSLIDENTQLIGKNNSLDFENKSLKKELNDLREFAKLISKCVQFRDDKIVFWTIEKNAINTNLGTQINEYECVKKVVEKYGKKED